MSEADFESSSGGSGEDQSESGAPEVIRETVDLRTKSTFTTEPTIAIDFDYVWLRVALDNERLATAARVRLDEDGPEHPSDPLNSELAAAIVAVTASAHAIDALYGRVQGLIRVPDDVRETWRANKTARRKVILTTFAFGSDIGGRSEAWKRELRWLFTLRDEAVHPRSAFRSPVAHPGGKLGTAQEYRDYSVETASRAIDFAFELIVTVQVRARTSQEPFREQSGRRFALLSTLGQRATRHGLPLS